MYKTWITILLALIVIVSSQLDCSNIPDPRVPGLSKYNITALVGKEVSLSDTFSTYKLRICQNNFPSCGACIGNTECCSGGLAGFCQSTDFWADCVGRFSQASGLTDTEGVTLLYEGGDWGMVGRITIYCDPTVEEIGNVRPENSNNYKHFLASSKHACPIRSDDSGTCSICTRKGCLWCLETNTCVCPPTPCQNFIKDPANCIFACRYPSCGTCAETNGCSWCLGGGSPDRCVASDNTDQCGGVVKDPSYCFWNTESYNVD